MNKQGKQNLKDSSVVVVRGKGGWGQVVKGKGGQIYSGKRTFGFGW